MYIHARIQEIFVGFGGGGSKRESSDHGFFKENYHQTITFRYPMEKDGPTFPGDQLSPGGRVQFYISI